MIRMLSFMLASGFSYVGWWLGAYLSIMTAFVLSMVGFGVGLYVSKLLAAHYFG